MPVKVSGIYERTTLLNNDLESSNFLQVNCCGIFEQTAESSITIRPHGRKDYQLIIISNGSAVINHNDKEIILSNGDMIIIPPYERNEYIYSDPIDALWIHFSGTAINNILDSYQLKPFTKYSISNSSHFLSYAEKIIKEFQLKRIGYMNNCNGYLLNILTLAKRRIDEQLAKNSDLPQNVLNFIVEEMKTNFADCNDISYYAKMCNLSISRFAHLFTENYGLSPYKYLLNIRLSQAKYLLTQTNINISEIAKSVGYDDPFYFSRIFKKNFGISPNKYRQLNKRC